MDERMERILEDFENNALGLDDTFQFRCRTCGKCCKNRHDLILTTRDLYNIAGYFDRTMDYIVERYCDRFIGDTSRIPIVRLRPSGPEQACPLLRNKRCLVHSVKPGICAIYPLGRGLKMEKTENGTAIPEVLEPTYFMQTDACGARDQTHTLGGWLEEFGIPIEDDFYPLWTEMIADLSKMFRGLESRKTPEGLMVLIREFVFTALYICYDPKRDLIPQFQNNIALLKNTMPKFEMESVKLAGGV